ncbi:unnamed protein product, partial [Didymodactylos carnosus]
QYTAEDLENAVKAVKNGLLIREASHSDNIPYSTLNDHVNENVTSFGSGPEQYVIQLGKGAMFKNDRPSYDWIQDFLKRHPTLTMKTSTSLERCRAALTQINQHEYSIVMRQVIVRRDSSNSFQIEGGTGGKSFTSILLCVNATGKIIPPYIIYKSKRLVAKWYGNGWMNQDVFYSWFHDMFILFTNDSPQPIVLFLDEHKSHFKVEIIQLAVQHKIVIICLPAHVTHILQPLNVVYFQPIR